MSPAAKQPQKAHHAKGQDGRANDELRHLRATVAALRDELDRARIAEEARVQKVLSTARDEILTLRQTAQVLREQLDVSSNKFREEREQLESLWRSQILEAQRTVVALRGQLEQGT